MLGSSSSSSSLSYYGYAAVLVGSVVTVWITHQHSYGYWQSLRRTPRVSAYGVYTEVWQLPLHFSYLLVGSLCNRIKLQNTVKDAFREVFRKRQLEPVPAVYDSQELVSKNEPQDLSRVIVSHSCRAIFYGVINALLDEQEQKTGVRKIRIATHGALFQSFQKLISTWENGQIEFYIVELKESDWTMAKVQAKKVKDCHLVLCQHVFGVPFDQDELFQIGRELNIPILEDCVQSGSMYSPYQGHRGADVCMWSGGLDKTPNCLGAGLALFRDTPHGRSLYATCSAWHDSLPCDTVRSRAWSAISQSIHVTIAKNFMSVVVPLLALCGTRLMHRYDKSAIGDPRHLEYVPWHILVLKVRQDKRISPFQHAVKKFLRQPSNAQLLSIKFGLGRFRHYAKVAAREERQRQLLLACTPSAHHSKLFPWLTPRLLEQHPGGISEFSWVAAEKAIDRPRLLDFFSKNDVITLENTTWETSPLMDKLVYLPNINQLTRKELHHVGAVLTKWCQQEYGDDNTFAVAQ